MCTAVTYQTKDHYFGRTLDLEYSYQETVTVTPRNFPFHFRNGKTLSSHGAIIGMATVMDGYLLGQCKTLSEVRRCLSEINLWKENFADQLPLSPLHWMISDKDASITVECVKSGLTIYENPVGVLTNNPCFDYHMIHLTEFINLTCYSPENRFGQVELRPYCKGMGAIGLPGDLSSASRFVRAAYVKLNSISGDSELESISQFFHILGSVEQQRGCVRLDDGSYEITGYTSCINTDRGIYYYTTYENQCISAVDMHRCDLDGNTLYSYPLAKEQMINFQN